MATDGECQQKKEIRCLLTEGIQQNLYEQFPTSISQRTSDSNNNDGAFIEDQDLLSFQNTLLIEQGLLYLSSTPQGDGGDTAASDECHIFSEANLLKLLCAFSLSKLSQISNRSGSIFKRHQQLFLEARYRYCLLCGQRENVRQVEIRKAWKELSNLTLVFCENDSPDTLEIQRKVSSLLSENLQSSFYISNSTLVPSESISVYAFLYKKHFKVQNRGMRNV